MITVDGLRGIPIFAPLPVETLEYVAGAVEDIHLIQGGDVRSGSVKRVAAGVGEGGMAIAFVHQYLALQRTAERPERT
ncbi:MAG: hypothetical protein ABW122_06870 [Ilumatobacteraceae bacterium]